MSAAVRRLSITRFEQAPASALRMARRGESVEITSHGKVVARLVPAAAPREAPSLDAALQAWRAAYPDMPDDPFGDEQSLRMVSPPREVVW